MEIIEKPPKMKLRSAVDMYFAGHPHEVIVGLMTKEGREFWFRRDPKTGEPIKISRSQAESM